VLKIKINEKKILEPTIKRPGLTDWVPDHTYDVSDPDVVVAGQRFCGTWLDVLAGSFTR